MQDNGGEWMPLKNKTRLQLVTWVVCERGKSDLPEELPNLS